MLPFETSAAAVRATAEARVHLVAPAGLRLIRLICMLCRRPTMNIKDYYGPQGHGESGGH